MPVLTAARLAPLLNGYTLNPGPPRTIVVPHASRLAGLQEVTVSGTLLKKQFIRINPWTHHRTVLPAKGGGGYTKQAADGDLHFCLGVKPLRPHIVCELQNAKAWLLLFNQSIGQTIAVSGFFRCLFEHPGFRANDDAHIFEIHPVRAVNLGGHLYSFDVDVPEQKSIHTWTRPHPLNDQDGRIRVRYDKTADTLTFTGMDGMDKNYVRVSGRASAVKLNANGQRPALFTFTSPEIGHPLQVYCLQGTRAARELRALKSPRVSLVALRNIDLAQALKNRYVINLLAIDIASA